MIRSFKLHHHHGDKRRRARPIATRLLAFMRRRSCIMLMVMVAMAAMVHWTMNHSLQSFAFHTIDDQADSMMTHPSHPKWSSPNTNTKPSMQYLHHHFAQLPQWMQSYLQWHYEMRSKFPDEAIYTNPDAPPLLIRHCRNFCGGLHDRLGQLEWDIYLAHRTGRVWMVWWEEPCIEQYLLPVTSAMSAADGSAPPLLNWTVPASLRITEMLRKDPSMLLFHRILKQEANVEMPNWSSRIDQAIERATTTWRNRKVLKYKLTAHEMNHVLDERLVRDGQSPLPFGTYSHLFHLLFRPHPRIQHKVEEIQRKWNIPAGQYAAVHWRVRYPMGVAKEEQQTLLQPATSTTHAQYSNTNSQAKRDGSRNRSISADSNGLAWHGASKDHAIQQATHALRCVQQSTDFRAISHQQRLPVFIYADSADLIAYLRNTTSLDSSMQLLTSNEAQTAVLHLDQQRGASAASYDATFVELFLASQAKCIAYGLGRFGLLAAKVSGTQCQMWYQREVWNARRGKGEEGFVAKCFASD